MYSCAGQYYLVLLLVTSSNQLVSSDVWKDLGLATPLPGLISSILHGEDKEADRLKHYNKYPNILNMETLRFVSVVARHGSRAPLFSYPTDPYPYTDERYWPDGPGHMTRYGKQQEFAVGQSLRRRYGGFLSANYSPNETRIASNNNPRDFETAACIAAGLYPPVGYQIWNPALLWNPIPLENEPFDVNELVDSDECPRFLDEARKRLIQLNAQSNKYRKIIDYVTRYTGTKNPTITEMAPIFDTLTMDNENGLSLPEWSKKVFPEKLLILYVLTFNTLMVGSENAIKFTGGPILYKIWDQLKDKARGALVPNLRMNILAGHDSTIRSLLSALAVDKPYFIQTSAYLIFELHENSRGNFVQLLYFNNSGTAEPIVFDIPACSNTPCPLTEFGRVTLSQQFPDWQKACNDN